MFPGDLDKDRANNQLEGGRENFGISTDRIDQVPSSQKAEHSEIKRPRTLAEFLTEVQINHQ